MGNTLEKALHKSYRVDQYTIAKVINMVSHHGNVN